MTAQEEAPELVALKRGRFALVQVPDGRLGIYWKSNICDTCQNCGCGDDENPFEIPAFLTPFVLGETELTGPGQVMGLVKRMMGNGK